MEAFIARQPIFDARRRVAAYELLYRDGTSGNQAVFSDGDRATRRLLSDTIIQFGLPKLTNRKPAYVNFTQNLIMNDFVLLARPEEVVVELLEDIEYTGAVMEKLMELKERGYVLALDDYTGGRAYDVVLPHIDILKVDFRLTSETERREIAQRAKKYKNLRLLAEKVETQEEFVRAAEQGYQLFQGYFFEKPLMMRKKLPLLSASSYGRVLMETQKNEINFDNCAQIVHTDAVLTYQIMKKVQKLKYYRGNIITAIRQALVMMGSNELRRWALLLLARENNVTKCDELVRKSYLRGVFAERLLEHIPHTENLEDGFLLGMFSLMDKIMGVSMQEVLKELELSRAVSDALLGRAENRYALLLQYIIIYEMANPNLILPEIGVELPLREVAKLYMNCLADVDHTFGEIGVDPVHV